MTRSPVSSTAGEVSKPGHVQVRLKETPGIYSSGEPVSLVLLGPQYGRRKCPCGVNIISNFPVASCYQDNRRTTHLVTSFAGGKITMKRPSDKAFQCSVCGSEVATVSSWFETDNKLQMDFVRVALQRMPLAS